LGNKFSNPKAPPTKVIEVFIYDSLELDVPDAENVLVPFTTVTVASNKYTPIGNTVEIVTGLTIPLAKLVAAIVPEYEYPIDGLVENIAGGTSAGTNGVFATIAPVVVFNKSIINQTIKSNIMSFILIV